MCGVQDKLRRKQLAAERMRESMKSRQARAMQVLEDGPISEDHGRFHDLPSLLYYAGPAEKFATSTFSRH